MSHFRKFDVRVGTIIVDVVNFAEFFTAKQVRDELIHHHCAPATISVYRNSANGCAYDSVARASHPEEL
jgi:hypothetical protein